MNSDETSIGYYLKDILSIEQCRYNMYHKEDIYNRIPQLIYRLSDDADTQETYNIIKECVETFEGKLEWTEFKGFLGKKVINHTISPLKLYEMQKDNFKTDNYVSEEEYFGKEQYQQLCEKAIDDIPALYKHIKRCLPKSLKKSEKVNNNL